MRHVKRFQILGHTIKVKKVRGLMKKHGCYGRWSELNQHIEIDPAQPDTLYAHTLWHEITHAILANLHYLELNANEQLVDGIGGALAQIHASMK